MGEKQMNEDSKPYRFSEQYPDNWKESLPVVLEALEDTRA